MIGYKRTLKETTSPTWCIFETLINGSADSENGRIQLVLATPLRRDARFDLKGFDLYSISESEEDARYWQEIWNSGRGRRKLRYEGLLAAKEEMMGKVEKVRGEISKDGCLFLSVIHGQSPVRRL